MRLDWAFMFYKPFQGAFLCYEYDFFMLQQLF